MKYKADKHLWTLELLEKYGIEVKHDLVNRDFFRVGEYMGIGVFGEKYRRTIYCEDNGKQPENGEYLLFIGFPTGPYSISPYKDGMKHYPIGIFYELFDEIKSYKPKYIDSLSNNLYFTLDNAKNVFNDFESIMEKYRSEAREDYKKIQIEKLEWELNKLKN